MRQTHEAEGYETVAIIGMAGHFPGAKNVDELWENLCNGVESVSFFTAEELQSSGVDPALLNDPTFVNAGAVLDEADCFDAAFFGITPREAEIMDPQHRVFLECAWEALEHAGYDPATYSGPVGVFGGVGPNTYFQYNLASQPELLEAVGWYPAMISNTAHFPTTRVSYKLNLKGPSINVQNACSTSGVAIHLACQSLLSGECDMALAGGARIKVPLKGGYFYQPDGIPSPDGHCRAFDAQAQGTVYGSGGAVITLKRLSDALHDGDSIYAVIKGSAINNDGAAKVGFTAPSVQGQAAAIAEAYALAGISADSLSYIEAHGTGTALGDPIEIAALTRAFQETTDKKQFCAIGSLKTNIGHLDAGAGVTSIIKTALALKHKVIPPSLHYQAPNPQIDFSNSPFYVSSTLSEWKAGSTPRRAGVSSFGLGGTNVHIVLEEPPVTQPSGVSRPWQLLPLSAKTSTALDTVAKNLAAYLQRHPNLNLADVAYTCGLGRQPFRHRRITVCHDLADAVQALGSLDPKRVVTQVYEGHRQSVVFMFPGGGAQYVNMGLDLYETESVFREHVDECLALLEPHAPTDLKRVLFPSADEMEAAAQRIEQPPIALPLLFTLEWAMARLLMSWGVQPAAMIGHSMGEYTAACLADVISLADALALVSLRGRLFATLPAGAMLSISAPEETVRALMGTELSIAAINKPSSCVVSGEVHAIEEMERRLAEKGIDYGRVHISVAAHSQMVEPILDEFRRFVESVELQTPSIPYVSNVTGTWITQAEATDPTYWVKHLRQTVRFSDGLQVLMKETEGVLLEVGPGQTLSTFARQHPDKPVRQAVISTFRHVQEQTSDVAFLLKAVGRLWLTGVEVDWSAFYRHERRQRIALPTYPFERTRYWINPPKVIGGKPVTKSNQEPFFTHAHAQAGNHPNPITNSDERIPMSTESYPPVIIAPRRHEIIVSKFKEILQHLSGVAATELDEHATFLEMGFDSLFLTRANVAFVKQFGVKITFRQLFRECPTLDALAAYIDRKLPPEPVVPEVPRTAPQSESNPIRVALPPAATLPSRSVESDTAATGALERIINQQLQVMAEQLRMLRNGDSSNEGVPVIGGERAIHLLQSDKVAGAIAHTRNGTASHASTIAVQAQRSTVETTGFGPFKPIKKAPSRALTAHQRQRLDAFIARYTSRTKQSKHLAQTYRSKFADPRTVSGFRALWKETVYPIVTAGSSGAKVWDVDGNEYLDVTMGFGSLIFGHSPKFITEALKEQIEKGIEIGGQSPMAGKVAELLCELTGMERATFCQTGSEAILGAIRAARTVTGRDRIAIFAGSYHGRTDCLVVKPVTMNGERRSVPQIPGIPEHTVEDTLILDYGDFASLDTIRRHADGLAAVLVEPVQSRNPNLQPREFLHALRDVTTELEIPLIFDEVITGFRVHPGGAQELFGVRADMATYGKAVGGGIPMAVLAGKALYLDAFDGGMWQFGDASFPTAGVTFLGGTFVKHPLALATSWAVLNQMKENGVQLLQRLHEKTTYFTEHLNNHFKENDIPIRIHQCASLFIFRFEGEQEFSGLLFPHLRAAGVHIYEDYPCFLSTSHTDEDVDFLIRAIKKSVEEMQDEGFLPRRESPPPHNNGPIPQRLNGVTQHQSTTQTASGYEPHVVQSGEKAPQSKEMTPRSLPLTEAQMEIWLLAQMGQEASCAFNLSYRIGLRGHFRLEAMHEAIQQLVDRHDALRMTFSADGSCLRFSPKLQLSIPLADLSRAEEDQKKAQLDEILSDEATFHFDLVNGPLMRARLVKLEEQHHLLMLTVHHIMCDGLSSGTIIHDLGVYYSAACQRIDAVLPEVMQFSKYVQWQQAEEQGPEYAAAEEYWVQRYAEPLPVLELPVDRTRPPVMSFRGAEQLWTIDGALDEKLRKLGARHGSTLFATLLAGYVAFLHRLTGQHDIGVGIPMAAQSIVGSSDLVGHCVNFLPLRMSINGEQSFAECLASVQELLLDAYEHRNYTFGSLLKKLTLARDPSRPLLVSTEFNLESEISGFGYSGLSADMSFNQRQFFNLDLGLSIEEASGELKVKCNYNTDLFDASTIRRWLENLQTLLQGIVAHPEQRISDLPFLTPAERQQLLSAWNDTQVAYPPDQCIHQLFEAQAERTPDAIAVIYEDQHLTYQDLNARANQLAHYLQRVGVGPETLVGLCVERSLEMVVGLLGILKAGGAYVPLDPSYPQARVQFMLEDANPLVLLTQARLHTTLPPYPGKILCLDRDWARVAQERIANPVNRSTSDNVAYTIYTSGSTGNPKGVQISHTSVVNFLHSMRHEPGMNSQDVLLSVTTLSFDIAGLEIFLPLVAGAKLVVMSRSVAADGEQLRHAVEIIAPTVLQATPVTWRMLIAAGWHGSARLKILCGGEALAADLAADLRERGSEVWNLYGPTETTIWSTVYRVDSTSSPIPIGRPIANTHLYLLDPHGHPVPIGVAGELYIGGKGVARGYYQRPELTAEKFLPDPFRAAPHARLYKTGDLARYRADGNLEYLGRIDQQIKLRGFRIELGEIEFVLRQHPKVQVPVVVAKENQAGDRQLVAYIVAQEGLPTTSELRDYLKTKLPDYMIPAMFVYMEALPLTPNGKVDRRALPTPAYTPDATVPFVAPQTTLEIQLTKIWEHTLGRAPIGRNENFFELGGHSLIAIRLFAQIEKQLGKKLPLATLFQAQTVEQLASLLHQQGWVTPWSSLVPIQTGGSKPPFFCIHDGYGEVLFYREFARLLGADQPVYGLQAQGLDGKLPPHGTVEEMAAHYLQEMRTLQPEGPYFLGSHCLGSVVAFEMAHQLLAQGQQIALLAMMDGASPPINKSVTYYLSYGMQALRHPVALARYLLLTEVPSRLKQDQRVIAHSLHHSLIESYESAHAVIFQVLDQAYTQYKPRQYPGLITYFMNSERARLPLERWGELAAQGVDLHVFPGDPHTPFQPPAVQGLAIQVSACLEKARIRHTTKTAANPELGANTNERRPPL